MNAKRRTVALLRIVPVNKDCPATSLECDCRTDICSLCEKPHFLTYLIIRTHLIKVYVGVRDCIPSSKKIALFHRDLAAVWCIRDGDTFRFHGRRNRRFCLLRCCTRTANCADRKGIRPGIRDKIGVARPCDQLRNRKSRRITFVINLITKKIFLSVRVPLQPQDTTVRRILHNLKTRDRIWGGTSCCNIYGLLDTSCAKSEVIIAGDANTILPGRFNTRNHRACRCPIIDGMHSKFQRINAPILYLDLFRYHTAWQLP